MKTPKRYFYISVTKGEYSPELIVGYFHGVNIKASKIYKAYFHKAFHENLYHSISTTPCSYIDYMKGTQPMEKKLIQPLQKNFIAALYYDINSVPGFTTLLFEERELIENLKNSSWYSQWDAPLLNTLLEKYEYLVNKSKLFYS